MFKRLAERVSSAIASATGPTTTTSSPATDSLMNMGFSESDARRALEANGGNVDRAADWLLTSQSSTNTNSATSQVEHDQLQKAINASLEDTRRARPQQSAAARRAGLAALDRLERVTEKSTTNTRKSPTISPNTTVKGNSNNKGKQKTNTAIASHPSVKMPKALAQHDKADVIIRCAQRVAPHSRAVDTLLRSLKNLQQDVSNLKYRTIDTTTAGYKRSLDVPGALDFLKAMGYHPSYTNHAILELSYIDPATFYLGISALEQIQETSLEYQQNKVLILFDRDIQQVLASADNDANEALKRSKFMSSLPSEPIVGGGQITVELGTQTKISRRFDGDDCLEDVLNWLGCHGSEMHDKLLAGKWYLVDRSHRNGVSYNLSELRSKTLQYIGCWPSGLLAVVSTPPTADGILPSSSRGLGAAPIDALTL